MSRQRTWIILVLFAACLLVANEWWRIRLWLDPIDINDKNSVVMYTTRWCTYCAKTREFLNTAQIPFSDHDIEESSIALREFKQHGGRGIPLVIINGTVIEGYDPGAMRSALSAPANSR